MKRIIAVLCILTISAVCLCGCMASGTETPTDTVEMTQE